MESFMADDTRDERLIEDYLFAGYAPTSRTNFDIDQQFAKPIEDDDLFGLNEFAQVENDVNKSIDLHDENSDPSEAVSSPFGDIASLRDDGALSPGPLFENELTKAVDKTSNLGTSVKRTDVDQMFPNDFSDKSQPQVLADKPASLSSTYSRPEHPSEAQIRKKLFREKIEQQLRLRAQVGRPTRPAKLDSIIGDRGLEVTIDIVPCCKSKIMFDRLSKQNDKKDLDESIEIGKFKRQELLEKLRADICTRKRKAWDSLLAPDDGYDDEEEFIESRAKDIDADEEDDGETFKSPDSADQNNDGNEDPFELDADDEEEDIAQEEEDDEDW